MKWSSNQFLAGLAVLGSATIASAQHGVEFVRPDAVIDLRTDAGATSVHGTWKYTDAQIVDVDSRAPGADLKPSGAAVRTHDIQPKAGAADFDDSAWPTIAASSLEQRRSNGRLAFSWYRLNVTVPSIVGTFDPTGSTIYFEISVDDYAEVWLDGKLPQVLGQSGAQMIHGWNSPNRVLLTRNARPGQTFQLAIFAANGPLSDPPANFIWVRSADLDFYSPEHASVGKPVETKIERLDPALDQIIAPGTRIEQLADGFGFTEGPV